MDRGDLAKERRPLHLGDQGRRATRSEHQPIVTGTTFDAQALSPNGIIV